MPVLLILGPRDFFWKALWRLHYGPLYGRRFPGHLWVRRGVRAFESRTARGDAPMGEATWNADWDRGRWAALRETAEAARYAVIGDLLRRQGPRVRVLDVGCGDGALRLALAPHGYARFDGIDIATPAVEKAIREAAGDPRVHFAVADAARFEPPTQYDAIVFNEAIYYLDEPERQARRYAQALAPGGRLVVSTFRSRRADAIGRALEKTLGLALLDRFTLSHPGRGSWVIRVFANPAP